MPEHSFIARPEGEHRTSLTPNIADHQHLMNSAFGAPPKDAVHRSARPPVEPAPTKPPVEPPPHKPPVEPPPNKPPVEPPPHKPPVEPPPHKPPVEPPPHKPPVEPPPPHNPGVRPYSPPAEPFSPRIPEKHKIETKTETPGKPATSTEVHTTTPEHVTPGSTSHTPPEPHPVVPTKPEPQHPTPERPHPTQPTPEHPTHPTPEHPHPTHHTPEHHPHPTHHTPGHHPHPTHHTPEHHPHPTHHTPGHHHPTHHTHHTHHHHHTEHHHTPVPKEHHTPVPPHRPEEHKPPHVPPPEVHKPVVPVPPPEVHKPVVPTPPPEVHKPVVPTPPPVEQKPTPTPPDKPTPPPEPPKEKVVQPTVEPPKTTVETTVTPAQPPHLEQKTTSMRPPNWGEVSTSFSSHQVLSTVTLGGNFNSRDYWRGSLDAAISGKHTGLGDLTLTVGHSLFDAYTKEGNARNGNVNFEVGAVLPTGKTFQFGKLPQVGDAGPVLGVNGYYGLDRKTTAYGSFNYALHPGSQSAYEYDAQAGVLRREGRFTFGLGGEVSKVDGTHTSRFLTPSVEYGLNKNTSIYASGALNLDGHKEENGLWTGFRVKF